jgi:hypothetical protein
MNNHQLTRTFHNCVALLVCTVWSLPVFAQTTRVPVAGDSRYFFSTLYAQAPEVAKKVAITAAMCGFPVTADTAMKLMGNEEFNRIGNNSTELTDKCNTLLTPARATGDAGQRSTPRVAPETLLMQAMSGGVPPAGNAAPSTPRHAAAPEAAQAYATPVNANGDKRDVDGLNGWKGYVVGIPAADARFAPIKIGMSNREVIDLIGPPNDQGMHVTGKAWIPYFGGAGKTESWMHYKGVGRLLLAQDGGANSGRFYVIGIEHDGKESGYR